MTVKTKKESKKTLKKESKKTLKKESKKSIDTRETNIGVYNNPNYDKRLIPNGIVITKSGHIDVSKSRSNNYISPSQLLEQNKLTEFNKKTKQNYKDWDEASSYPSMNEKLADEYNMYIKWYLFLKSQKHTTFSEKFIEKYKDKFALRELGIV